MERIAVIIFFYVVFGVPFSWRKFVDGLQFQWVGFELFLQPCKFGLTRKRAEWLRKWLGETASHGKVKISDMRVVLGRLSFGSTALGHLRPFLGPIYAWAVVMGRHHVCIIPKAILLSMNFLIRALEGEGHFASIQSIPYTKRELFKTDARVSGNEVDWRLGIGQP